MSTNEKPRYYSESRQRMLRIMLALAGREFEGAANGELAKDLSISASNVTHDLHNLMYAGLAEEIPDTGRWRLTPRLSQIGLAMLDNVNKTQRKVDEIQQRYTRKP